MKKLVSIRIGGKSLMAHITPVFLALFLSLYTSLPGAEEILDGHVVAVHDGDTVTLLIAGNQQVKIRLAQIDAPETSGQAFGQRSQQSLSDMVFNKNVRVEKDTIDCNGQLKQDTLLSRFLIEFPFIFERRLIT